ncbi:mucin-5AC-like [Dermacentor albipictus]|uniref:mucin-5AC-like n=1 Tax=Dermacentor albipictus TaxID=60249 RepID=UPI0038FD36B1
MGASKILSLLLATLLSDSVVCGRRAERGLAKGASAAEVSSSHGRTFANFDSSPALTHLEFDEGSPSKVHRHGGDGGDPSAVFPPEPHPGSAFGSYDYAPHDRNYPQWHQPQSFHDVDAAPSFWQAYGEETVTKRPASALSTDAGRQTVDLSEFHPTHSFFGSMFTVSPDTGDGSKSSPPAASPPEAVGSSVDKGSRNATTAPGEDAHAVSTSVRRESYGVHVGGKAAGNYPPDLSTSLVQHRDGGTETPNPGSPTVGNEFTQTRETGRLGRRRETGTFLRTTSTAMGVAKDSSETPTRPDLPRGTDSTRGAAAVPDVSRTTAALREPSFADADSNFVDGDEAARTTRGVTSTAAGASAEATSSTVPAPAPEDFVPRQAAAETVASTSKPAGGFAQLATPTEAGGGADKIVETTTGRVFTHATTASRPAHPETSTNETETPATQSASKITPPDNASQTLPSRLPESTETPKLATSPRETLSPVQHVVFRNESSDLTTTQATTNSSAVSEIAGLLSDRLETTTSPATTNTALGRQLQNGTTASLTRAPVEDGNGTSTRPVESSTLRQTFPAATAGVRRQTTTTSSPTTAEPTRGFPTVPKAEAPVAQATPARNAGFKQTLPPPPPVGPPKTTRPPVTADAYVRPITQHGVHEFVPQRHRDVEDYFYHGQPGHMEDHDEVRRSQCGRCQRRLHYCVQKCFVHHSCEAETNADLTCPRINAPCMPPYKHEVDQCRHSSDCESANHLCCLVGCSRRCVHGVPVRTQH